MALTINVGYSEKLGQPDYGSIGASCHVECELDGRLVDDPNGFQTKVRELYAACSQAVQDELGRRQTGHVDASKAPANGSRKVSKATPAPTATDSPATMGSTNHRASGRQLEYVQQLARQIPKVGARGLESLAERICGKPIAELSSFDASSLIDTLKAIKAGNLNVDTAALGAAP